MTPAEIAYLLGTLIAALIVCELPTLATLNRAKLRCWRVQCLLAFSWILTVLNIGLMLMVGSVALKSGNQLWIASCVFIFALLCWDALTSFSKARAVNHVFANGRWFGAAPATRS